MSSRHATEHTSRPGFPRSRGVRRRTERGATVVEYALIVAVLAVPSVAGIEALRDSAARATGDAAEEISSGYRPVEQTEEPPPSVPSTPDPTTTTPSPTAPSPTTAAPTTAPTTTGAPPTTVAPTTTVAPVATAAAGEWGSATVESLGPRWRAMVPVTVLDDLGGPVADASVTLRIEVLRGGTWRSSGPDLSAVTPANGSLVVETGELQRSGPPSSRVARVRISVVSLAAPGLDWSGGPAPAVVDAP